ncbi:hypothetical protein PMAYCL1PPCAC_29799, partial [Pristionchus mayeri]
FTSAASQKTKVNESMEMEGGEEEDDERGTKKGFSSDRGMRKKKLSRLERMENWFMKKPIQKSLPDFVLYGNEPLHYVVFLRAQVRGWNGAEQTSLEGEVNITLIHT